MRVAALLVFLVAIAMFGVPTRTAPKAVMDKGQTYLVVWDCLPKVGCFGELLRVRDVREDGWVEVEQCRQNDQALECDKERWLSNPGRAISIRRYQVGSSAND